MSYTWAEVEPLAARLVADLPGLDIRLARVWIRAESGAHNNPLGVTATRGSGAPVGQWIGSDRYLVAYPSRIAGIDAAAALVRSSSNYSGIMASLGGSLRTQALAVIASPWHRRNSPYYTVAFTAAGLLSGSGPAAPKTNPRPDAPDRGRLGAWGDIVSFPVGHILTAADVDAIMQKLSAAGFFPFDIGSSHTRAVLGTAIGKAWNKDLQVQLQGQFGVAAAAAAPGVPDIAGAIAGLPATLGGVASKVLVNTAILVLILVLAYSGLEDLLAGGES